MTRRDDIEAIRRRQAEIAPAFDYEHGSVMFDDVTTAAQMATDARDLLALVDLQTRALLAVEWGRHGLREEGQARYFWVQCPQCFDPPEHGERKHKPDCTIDAALTAAGFHDQASRDAARKERR